MQKYNLYFISIFIISHLIYPIDNFFSPFSPKKAEAIICQDNSNFIPKIKRGGELSCPVNSTIHIDKAFLDLSTENGCPLHYNKIPYLEKPVCNKIVDNDVTVYLKSICNTNEKCQFSFQSDLPQLKCFDNNNIVDIGAVYSSIRVTYYCNMKRMIFWPFRRNRNRRKRVNIEKFRTIKKLRSRFK